MLSLLLCFVMLVGLVPITAYAAATIDRADILIAHPVHLANPETFAQVYGNCQVDTTYNTDNFKNGLRWREVSTGKVMSVTDTFVGGNLYELSVLLISKTGYAFSASATTVTINMDQVSLTVLDVNRAKATITLTADNLYINHVTINDLDSPTAGNTPDFSATLQENTCNIYTTSVSSGIVWYDHDRQAYLSETDRFQSGHQYSVGVYVQAKPGYEFPQNAQVSINGGAGTIGQNDGQMLKAALEYPALVEAHTHAPSAWRTTGAYHYKVCTTCGDFLEQEDHKGGNATCAETGKCSVCNYAYLEVTENHTPDTGRWTACGNLYHAHLCKVCGAHCDPQEHIPGAAATETAAQTCTVCGYVLQPVKQHTHQLTLMPYVAPTCWATGTVKHYQCSGCSTLFADAQGKERMETSIVIPQLTHETADDWSMDAQFHWRSCRLCKTLLDETKMVHEIENGKCVTCGYGAEPAVTQPEPAESAPVTPTPSQKNQQWNNFWLPILLVALVCFSAALTATTVVILKKKKGAKP